METENEGTCSSEWNVREQTPPPSINIVLVITPKAETNNQVTDNTLGLICNKRIRTEPRKIREITELVREPETVETEDSPLSDMGPLELSEVIPLEPWLKLKVMPG